MADKTHPNDDHEILVLQKEYTELLRSQEILDALYAAGVDNWEWYEEALRNIDA